MLKKFLIVSMAVIQCMLIASSNNKDQETNKMDKPLSQSQPIVITIENIRNVGYERLSKSDPGAGRSLDNSPTIYLNYGDLGNGFSPYDDSQR